MMPKILPKCPCCGGKAKEESTHGMFEGYGDETVYCQKCSMSGKREDWIKRIDKDN